VIILLIIKKLWATADEGKNYLDVSHVEEDVENWLKESDEAVQIIQGFGVFDSETNLMVDEASDFLYTYEEAQEELKSFTA
jgi:hypothetical protein